MQIHRKQSTMPYSVLALGETHRQRRLIGAIERLYDLWGYWPIHVPIIDYATVYEPFLPDGERDRAYRLFDFDGEPLLLCPDITLYAARHVAARLRDWPTPLRLFYADTILRRQQRHDIFGAEFFQSGVELIGAPGREADLEIVMLLLKTLAATGLTDFYCHLGSRTLLDAALASAGIEDGAPMAAAIAGREWGLLKEGLRSAGLSLKRIATLRSLFAYIGDAGGLRTLMGQHASRIEPAERAALDWLLECYDTAIEIGATGLRIDLSEVGTQPYHTGIAFQVYTPNGERPVASGGRYDRLLGLFGYDAPSVGFSLYLRTLSRTLPKAEATAPTRHAEGASFSERYRDAMRLRANGIAATL